ncbi:hypothetical protein Tco_0436524 [Tanacetum coccineum]
MSNQLEDIQAAGSDTRPPMLDKTDFESWQQRIPKPIQDGTCRDEIASGTDGPYLGPERDTMVADLSQAEKDRLRVDIRATNILLQGLPRDIYKLINHNTDAKDIWDNVKMLLEGSELTKDDHESQLYDEFKHSGQHKGENIHDYYVMFTKLINDMKHIKMTMPKIQLNSKLVNNMLPEWGRSVMAIKLNRGLKESNHDQLYAYLKQHELHANENKMLMERLNQHSHDPLALVSHVMGELNTELEKMLLMQAQENGVDLDEEQLLDFDEEKLLFLAADQCDAFDSNVDEAPTTQTMFMANLSSADPVYDEAGLSYDSDTLSKAKSLKEKAKSAKTNDSYDGVSSQYTCKAGPQSPPNKKSSTKHFEGIQKALINEIEEMKEVFDQIEAEVDQHAVDKKCDEIERKNLLIENKNRIVECLSQDVFYTATDSVLTVSRFSDMHDAYTVAQKCIAKLEAENSNLTQKIQKDDHDEMIKHFSKLEVEHLNLKLKYQHLKERFGNKNQ